MDCALAIGADQFQSSPGAVALDVVTPARLHRRQDCDQALLDAVTKPGSILPVPAGTTLGKDQQEVLTFIRRQAIRALAQVRFAELRVAKEPGPGDLYPAFTLAQIAVSDPAISPPPTETEIAEAVIGLCNMTPPTRAAEREQYAYAMADAIEKAGPLRTEMT